MLANFSSLIIRVCIYESDDLAPAGGLVQCRITGTCPVRVLRGQLNCFRAVRPCSASASTHACPRHTPGSLRVDVFKEDFTSLSSNNAVCKIAIACNMSSWPPRP